MADLRLALEDRGLSSQAISLIVRGVPNYSQWKLWKKWCLDNSLLIFTSRSVDEFEYFDATVQLVHFLANRTSAGFSAGDLGSCRSAVSTVISCLFNCASLSDSPQVSRLFMGFSKDKPSQPRWSIEDDAWNPGLIIDYWMSQPDNSHLSIAELGYKSWSLFGAACWPRCSDGARLVRSSVRVDDAGWLRFRYKGTKELKFPILSQEMSIPAEAHSKVCPATAVTDYIARTKDFLHDDRVWCSIRPLHGAFHRLDTKGDSLRRWMRLVMTRAGVPAHWTGGSIRMAASSRAADLGADPAWIMKIGRWSSWSMWNRFYNRSGCRHGPASTSA